MNPDELVNKARAGTLSRRERDVWLAFSQFRILEELEHICNALRVPDHVPEELHKEA